MEILKKERIEGLNKEFEQKKKELIDGFKDSQISQVSEKLIQQ